MNTAGLAATLVLPTAFFVGCSFDFTRGATDGGGDGQEPPLDTGVAREGSTPPPDGPSGPPLVIDDVAAGSYTCTTPGLAGGGTECAAGEITRSYPSSVDQWHSSCAGDLKRTHAICIPGDLGASVSINHLGPLSTDALTVACADSIAEILVGGGCSCSGALLESRPTEGGSWSCRCTTASGVAGAALCVPRALVHAPGPQVVGDADPGAGRVETGCEGLRLISGGCESFSGGLVLSIPTDGDRWACQTSDNGLVTPYAICVD